MTPTNQILFCVLFQISTAIAIGLYTIIRRSFGFPLIYLINLTILHAGAFVYLNPLYDIGYDPYIRSIELTEDTIARGYFATCFGIPFLFLGILLADFFCSKAITPRIKTASFTLMQVAVALICMGGAAYVVTRLGAIPPGFHAVLLVGRNATVVGLYMAITDSLMRRFYYRAMGFTALFLLIPAYHAVFEGFLALGTQYAVILLITLISEMRATPKRVACGIVGFIAAVYLFLSAMTVYLENRVELRSVLWSDASFTDRTDALINVFYKIEPFNFSNLRHLALIDSRFNQNIYIGKTIDYLEFHPDRFANGNTIALAVLSWVPRALWPDKPVMGGTRILAEYSGLKFDESTTMQTGQIFEFYINFGLIGIAFGMTIYGFVLRYVDLHAASNWALKDFVSTAKYFLLGIVLVWPGEILISHLSALAATLFVSIFLGRYCSLFSSRSLSVVS